MRSEQSGSSFESDIDEKRAERKVIMEHRVAGTTGCCRVTAFLRPPSSQGRQCVRFHGISSEMTFTPIVVSGAQYAGTAFPFVRHPVAARVISVKTYR